MSNDLSPEQYIALEQVEEGYNRVGDLPIGCAFRSHRRSSIWYVAGPPTDLGRIPVAPLYTSGVLTDCPAAMSVWVD